MSVLIRGMEMPMNCAECMVHLGAKCGTDYKYLLRHTDYYDAVRPDCPLVFVPDHGRLLDEEVIKAHSESVKDHTGRVEEIIQMRYLDRIPTVIPEDKGAKE